jgi:murein DD-endopeptidase MepM/ murein hydrolase activator NlpD
MNIIIVGKSGHAPKTLKLDNWRARLAIIGFCVSLCITFVVTGLFIGTTIGGPALARTKLHEARDELNARRSELSIVRQNVERDMDALAIRLGKLQAEAMRLNALGERLAKVGKLEDGEFNFSDEPALGGPELVPTPKALSMNNMSTALQRLETQFDHQSQQLSMLESMLLDEQLNQALLPAGKPVRSGYASSGFGYRTDPFTGRPDFHPGVDFNGPRGTEILAVAAGVVSFSGQKAGYGNIVEVDHGNGYLTRYAHNDSNNVQVGDPVRTGDLIARMGSTGRATGVHVHFEVWLNGHLVNPTEYIRAIR